MICRLHLVAVAVSAGLWVCSASAEEAHQPFQASSSDWQLSGKWDSFEDRWTCTIVWESKATPLKVYVMPHGYMTHDLLAFGRFPVVNFPEFRINDGPVQSEDLGGTFGEETSRRYWSLGAVPIKLERLIPSAKVVVRPAAGADAVSFDLTGLQEILQQAKSHECPTDR